MPATPTPEILLEEAEEKIQKILLRLSEQIGRPIEHVDVDTRNFANLKTEIFVLGANGDDGAELMDNGRNTGGGTMRR